MKPTIYKLEEYKIIESKTGELNWEAHFGLGAFQEGRCFRKGRILFIGPAENDRPGFLKGEFLDHLKPFPGWLKTKYYSRDFDVYHCPTGKRVTKEEMLLWMIDRGIDEGDRIYSEKPGQRSNNISTGKATDDVAFRLKRYEIIKKTNGQIEWKTYAGPNTVSSGTCLILEDILFIGSRQNEQSTLIKRQFLENLQLLSKWDHTKYYCPKLSLHDCETGNRVQGERKRRHGERRATEKHDIRDGYKNTTEFKIPIATQLGIFSARIFPIFNSPENPAVSRGEHDRFFRFKFKKSYISKSIAIFRTSGISKWITHTIMLIFMIILLVFAFFIGCWKECYKRWHYKKGEHSSSHHRDH